jgi:hypothetical protein
VLFKAYGLNLTSKEVNAILISASIALQVAAKYMMLKSITKSETIIPFFSVEKVLGTVSVPEMTKNLNISYQELKSLHLKIVEWNCFFTLGITLSNGESCTAGSNYKVNQSHSFDPNKKITKVEVIISKDEDCLLQINFYSGKETLVKVGWPDYSLVKQYGVRVESF